MGQVEHLFRATAQPAEQEGAARAWSPLPSARKDREVVELLRQLARAQGCAIIMVTHNSRILDLADRSLRLEDGRVSTYGAALTADSAHMLTALSAFRDDEGLTWRSLEVPDVAPPCRAR